MAATAFTSKNLCEVERLGLGELVNLLAATEAVSDHDGGRTGSLDGRKQALVSDGLRNFELVGLEPKGTSHAAATGMDGFDLRAGLTQ